MVHPIFSIKITILREFFALFPDTAIYKNRSGTLWDIYGCSKKNVRYLYEHHKRWLKKERIVGLREKKQTIKKLIIKKTKTNKQ